MTDTQPKLWERQPYDTDKSFQAFCIYRDMGTQRTLDKAYTVYKKGGQGLSVGDEILSAPTFFTEWSSENNWVDRVSAYIDYMASIDAKEREEWYMRKTATQREMLDTIEAGIVKRLTNLQKANYITDPDSWLKLLQAVKTFNDEVQRAGHQPHRYNDTQRTEHTGAEGGDITIKVIRGNADS